MRRTRENWLQTPTPRQKEISSLRIFNGEDLHFHERRKSMMEVQKKWLDEQMKEARVRKAKDSEEKKLFEFQSYHINQNRILVEEEKSRTRQKSNQSTRDFNKKLAEELKEQKKYDRKQKILAESADLKYFESLRKVGPFQNPLIYN